MKPKIFFLCPGLGRITRGYESFIKECHIDLMDCDLFDIHLYKSAGPKLSKSTNLPSLFRRSKFTKLIAKLFRRHPYYIEQATFALSVLPFILLRKPRLIFLSDGALANAIWHFRNIFNLNFKIIFSNGGPLPSALKRWDRVQQLVPAHLEQAIADGVPSDKQTLLPYGVKIKEVFSAVSEDEKKKLRLELDLPQDRCIVISVGTINKHHKRMDYLIEEIASIPGEKPYLLILGQEEIETDEIKALAGSLLGSEDVTIRNVPHEEMNQFYRASDIFVLASLHEGLARVFLEASAKGLPCIAHDYEVPRFALGKAGFFVDMKQKGALADCVCRIVEGNTNGTTPEERHAYAYNNFSWDKLKDRYIEFFSKELS